MFNYKNTRNTEIEKDKFIQKFNYDWFSVVIDNIILKTNLESSTQYLDNEGNVTKEILTLFAFCEDKDLTVNVYFDILYRENNKIIVEDYHETVKKELSKKIDEKIKENKELKRKEQRKYFAIKNAMNKKQKGFNYEQQKRN